ncbi:MAG: ArsA family ATPase [Myxococcales bacterium]|nr:TRC40/GET3/ArsA family transport-energizing ATPase [Myxococcales bacterium]
MTRYTFFAGKGGVGKTTCAAAAALGSSRHARTLVVSTDPAHSLGDAFEVRLGAAPRAVRGRLFAAEMDADRALARWLGARERAFREIAARGTYFDDEDIDSLFRLSLPGVDELVALIELERLASGFEHVLVDTAPTGHTLRLLEMPKTLGHLAKVLDDLQAKHRALARSLRGTVRRDAEDAVIDELQERAAALGGLLRSAEFQWVTLAEEMSLLEAQDGIGALRAAGMRVTRLIANRLTPRSDRRCSLCAARRREEARVLAQAKELRLPIAAVADQDAEPRGLRALAEISADLARSLGHLTKTTKSSTPPARESADGSLGHLTKEILPAGLRLLFVGGKGGVGKSTAAAALALASADSGQRTLLLSTDPAHSISDVLRTQVGDREVEVAPRLWTRELDAAQAFRARRERYRSAVDELFDALRGGSSFDAPYDRAVMRDLIELAPPGLDELFGLLAVIDALQRVDVVVVDTAPTGHALRLLELVAKAREWIQVLLQILLKYRRVTGLGRLAKDLTDTARELREFETLLGDPVRAAFLVVTRAAALPRLETGRLLAALHRLRVTVPAVLVNALTPPGCSRCGQSARVEAREMAALRKARRGWAMLGAPAVAPGPRGLDALREFGRTWTRSE